MNPEPGEVWLADKYIGSNFDDFLKEAGLLAEVEANAIKRIIACQIAELMKKSIFPKQPWLKKNENQPLFH